MDKKIFICAACDKNTRDNPIEMWFYCHKHFNDFIKREQLETAKEIFEELESFFRKNDNQGFYIKRLFLEGHILNDYYEEIKAKFLQEKMK